MKTQELFNFYEETISSNPNIETIFSNSGLVNEYGTLDFGFFPLGSGILATNKSQIKEAEITNCNVMVLGNDFGTQQYISDSCADKKEKPTNATIRNLVSGLELDLETTFFTNLFLGLRREGTNIKRVTKLNNDYKDLCFAFFKKQLEYFNPKVVLCLGIEVGQSLAAFSNEFSNFSLSKTSILKLFADTQTNYVVHSNNEFFGQRKFVLIPHPSFAHINWSKNDIKKKIENALQN